MDTVIRAGYAVCSKYDLWYTSHIHLKGACCRASAQRDFACLDLNPNPSILDDHALMMLKEVAVSIANNRPSARANYITT